MALLSRAGLFRFCLSEIPMPILDIVTKHPLASGNSYMYGYQYISLGTHC